MQTRMIIAGVALALAISTGCGSPEKKIAGSVEDITSIMESNLESPKAGVEKLRDYARDNLPGILEAYGKAIAELDKIEDPKARAERAKEMVEAMKAPMEKATEVGQKFVMAAMKDEETMKYVMEIGKGWSDTAEQLEGVMKALGKGIASANPEAGAEYHAAM